MAPNRSPFESARHSDLRPYLSAQTTWGSDAHFGASAMRTGTGAYPLSLLRLAPGRPVRPVPRGRHRP